MTLPVRLLLFLDFDGVLHPLWEPTPDNDSTLERIHGAKAYTGPFFVHAPLLAELLRPILPEIDIVISSTWGRKRDLATLQGLLPDELASRVKDAVHHHLPPLEAYDKGKDLISRWAEIAWYREYVRPDIGSRWLAIDDDNSGWPPTAAKHLAHCNRDLGDTASQKAVIERIFQAGKTSLREGAALSALSLDRSMEPLAEAGIPVVEFDEDDVTNAFKDIREE